MSYSSAWFEPGDTFEQAQFRKIDGVLDMAGVGQGTQLIEIGCIWGSLAIRAAQRGARVVGLTLSIEQQDLARRRVAAAGVTDLVEIRLEDYRVHAAAHRADYDAAVSVEMIENVGETFWPDYFTSVATMLRPGARFALQSITIDHDRVLATRHGYTWVVKYIFPGGRLPSLTAIDQQLAARTSLRVLESRSLGRPYGGDAAPMAAQLRQPPAAGRPARLRRDLHANVGLLPGLLRGRVRRRLPGRLAIEHRLIGQARALSVTNAIACTP